MGDPGGTGDVSKRARLVAASVGLSAGLASGAVLLGAYGFARRDPAGLHEVSVRNWAAGFVVLVTVAALVLAWLMRSALRGVDVVGRSAWLLTVVAAAGLYALLADLSGLAASTHTAVVLLRLSWVWLLVAAIFVVAAVVAAVGRPDIAQVWRSPVTVVLLALGVIFALGCGALAQARTKVVGITAAPVDIPATMSTVGDQIAYTVPTKDPSFIAPAGPGFVTLDDQDLVGYAGDTGQQRWRLPFKMIAGQCEPSTVRSTGTSADSVVIAQCLQPNPSYSYPESDRRTILTGIDAMTGRVLWANADSWRLRSTVVTGPDVVPVLRGVDVGALDTRTGKVLWTKQFALRDCGGNIAGAGNKTQDIVYFPMCPGGANDVVLDVIDGRTGAERTLAVDHALVPEKVSRAQFVAAAAGVIVINVAPPASAGRPVNIAVDVDSGQSSPVPGDYLFQKRDAHATGQYPGPVLQINRDSDDTSVYVVGDRRTVQTRVPIGLSEVVLDGQRWARVGDQLVTATAMTAGYRYLLAIVAADGTVTSRPSPCGAREPGGVIPVPGAVLIACAHTDGKEYASGYTVVGLR
ncbi:hypothetical protein DE4585_02628 [Mycobacteroides salmoniphilum]|uniref:PQQ enzyme repeat protein n=1 Tax=Mycobacteroides salmoniphilum TaxID=404941 RepID=A0A4R8S2J2_9MYCO|nr:PQQ-binding-like beta-propeller repeat protein [Mycobacteroides salmoniphilum]TDZ82099.1 hypothetical protein DE4585_02628 [Mycobacteroides salmoniphilum]